MITNPKPLFSFGTLMDLDLLSCVTNLHRIDLTVKPGVLSGYQQRNVQGENFPVILADEHSTTTGVVIEGLNDEAIDRILFYEGDEYYLAPATVTVNHNANYDACVFLSAGVYRTGAEVWDFTQWVQNEKAGFLSRVENYMQYYGKLSATEADQYW